MPFDTIPKACYSICNNAYLLASSLGKSDELCDPSGDFFAGYNACVKCVQDNLGDSKTSPRELLDPEFSQFLNYCPGIAIFYTVGTFTLNPTSVITISYLTAKSILSTALNTTSTATLGTTSTTPTSLNVQPSSTSEIISSPSVSPAASETGKSSKTHLAGPIAGSLAGLALIIIVAIFFWRRRLTRKNSDSANTDQEHFEKAQLHSDCVPIPHSEIAGGEILEMEGSTALYAPTAEKPSNEAPAQELPGEHRGTKTRPVEVEG